MAMTIFILAFPHSIMRMLGAKDAHSHLASYGADYLSGYTMAAMTLVNIAGDIYVVLFTDAGVFGLALITSLGNAVYGALNQMLSLFGAPYLGRRKQQVLMMGSEAIRYLAFSLPFFVFNFGFVNYLQSIKKFVEANVLTLIMQLIVPVGVIFLSVKFMQGDAWRAVPISAFLISMLCAAYIFGHKEQVGIKKRLLLGKGSFSGGLTEVSLVADTAHDVMGMSHIAQMLCLENGAGGRTAMHLALCVEELGMNIIEHGFNDGKEHYIYLRIIAKEDKIILRIRDDCEPFNPLEYYEMTRENQDDPASNIGIRLVVRTCSDIVYVSLIYLHMFRTNNLIITVPKERKESNVRYRTIKNFRLLREEK